MPLALGSVDECLAGMALPPHPEADALGGRNYSAEAALISLRSTQSNRKTELGFTLLCSFLKQVLRVLLLGLRCSCLKDLKTLKEVGMEKLTVKSLQSCGLGSWGQLKHLRKVTGVIWEAGKMRSMTGCQRDAESRSRKRFPGLELRWIMPHLLELHRGLG